ncbi:transmembrane protein 132C-like isoform X3 [Paramormyrops kingsleyae]|uniref:transmembrane protein 132C-like isoform X3 n=1 Tax=Paramormyrops kingsleyae TaxID=1676925 RepID=UPI000CD5CCCD|nr:transmembrane protein 132C-like isoform X3 [Paramormyrops kingsleyae]
MEVCATAKGNMLLLRTRQLVMAVLFTVDCRGILESLPRFSSTPTYLPVDYQVLDADLAFFLKEANQDFMRNSSLQLRTEAFFVYQARHVPSVNASYGPLSVARPVPLELLQPPGPLVPSSMFTFNWKVQAFILGDRIYPGWPKVQVLFYVAGRDWDDYSVADRLPCVQMFAFHETQEVRGTCRLRGELGLCVAELEPLAGWFSPPSVVPGRQRAPGQPEGTPVELYYLLQSAEGGQCGAEDPRKGSGIRLEQAGPFSSPMRRIGNVRLCQGSPVLPLADHRLDKNFVVQVPSGPVRQRDVFSAYLSTPSFFPVDSFILRVKLKEGVVFLGAKPTAAVLWAVSQDMPSNSRRVVTLHCRRKESGFIQSRTETGFQKILQVDLEVEGFLGQLGGRSLTWQVEYPGSRRFTEEVETEVRLAQQELRGIVPLAMDTEILNTAVLTGRTVAVPVKVVTVGADGKVTDVSDAVKCRTLDEDVVKVSDRCDYVFVNGKEMKGKVKMAVNFTYSHLSAQLEMTVWIPRLPLQIEVSDAELSQIKGWRVPTVTTGQRSARDSEEEDDEERRGRSCGLQYQQTALRVLAHFVAEAPDARSPAAFMLGSDWQADVTELVRDFLKVENPRVARLRDGRVLVGVDVGMTTIQVLSPLSDAILAEKTVTVLEDKVTITELGVQLVTGLSLSLQLSPGSNRAIVATATAQEVLQSPKQEAPISAWLQFSDGSMAPLDLYEPGLFVLSVTSLDEGVVTVRQDPAWRWPIVVAEAEGQGALVRAEITVSETCQKSKRRSVLVAGSGIVRVRFGSGEELENHPGDRRQPRPDSHFYGSSVAGMEDGVARRSTTTRSAILRRPGGGRLTDDGGLGQNGPIDFSDFPAQVDLPGDTEDDLVQAHRGLSDLEIGMYALLGVFCLAILVFLINCVSYALKYRHKELSEEGPETLGHAHDWVWLGHEAEPSEGHSCSSPQQEERGSVTDAGVAFEEGSHLLNGGSSRKNVQGQVHREAGGAPGGVAHKGDSPTSRRKRVKFTTFTTIPLDNGCPSLSPVVAGHSDGIKWVCQDIELGDSKELRDYMERLNGNALKDAA